MLTGPQKYEGSLEYTLAREAALKAHYTLRAVTFSLKDNRKRNKVAPARKLIGL